MTLNNFVLEKNSCIFELGHYFILFLSTAEAAGEKTGRKQFPVTVLCTINGLLVLILRVFNFFKLNCTFYVFTLFTCRIIILLTSPIEGKQSKWNAQRWNKAYIELLTVFVQ